MAVVRKYQKKIYALPQAKAKAIYELRWVWVESFAISYKHGLPEAMIGPELPSCA